MNDDEAIVISNPEIIKADDCDCVAFGFKSCKGRKRCKGCEYFRPGDPYRDKVCYCPENVEIPDDEAMKFLRAFADASLQVLRESIDKTINGSLKERNKK